MRWGKSVSSPFRTSNGIRQGSLLSPYLYNVFADSLSHALNRTGIGCIAGDVLINHLAYADDVDFMGEGYLLRDNQMTVFRTESGRAGLLVKECKTKMMLAARRQSDADFIDIGGLMLEVVDQFRYLGSTVTSDNEMIEEIKIRISNA